MTCSVTVSESRDMLTSMACHDGSRPLRPMPYIHHTELIRKIHPNNPARVIRMPSFTPVLVEMIMKIEPGSTATATATTRMPRIVGSNVIAAINENMDQPSSVGLVGTEPAGAAAVGAASACPWASPPAGTAGLTVGSGAASAGAASDDAWGALSGLALGMRSKLRS